MTHYQKLATLLFRSVAVVCMLIGVYFGLVGLGMSLLSPLTFVPLLSLFNSLPPIVLGIVLFSLSKLLARFICNDFDEFNRP
jgi:hypothetical protein